MEKQFIQQEWFRIEEVIDEVAFDRWHKLRDGEDGQAWETTDGMRVIWSVAREQDGEVWMHVSISRFDRLPSYGDQVRVKNLFIGIERYAYSVWPPVEKHVNIHERCLHLWSRLTGDPPLPDFTRGGASI